MNTGVIRRIFFLVLGMVYISAGIFIWWKNVLPAPWGIVLMIIFAAYGLWRMSRGLKRNHNHDYIENSKV
jgi:UPF0716 family protein affecting phage T7 exclusion